MWLYNDVRIYVQSLDRNRRHIIARLQPLSAQTVLQLFGYESTVWQVEAKVVGEENLQALYDLIPNDVAYTLSGYGTNYGSLYLASITSKREAFAYQTIDESQDCEAPVFTITMELY